MDSLDSLAFHLGSLAPRVGPLASAAVRKTAHDIEATAKELCPVDTGNLRNSISTTVTGDGRYGAVEAEIGPTADYGAYVEFGTSRQAPAAYMGPALDRHGYQLDAALGQLGDLL